MSEELLETALQTYLYCKDKTRRKINLTTVETEYMQSGELLGGIWDSHFEIAKVSLSQATDDEEIINFEDFREEHGCICLTVGGKKFWYPIAIAMLCPTGNILSSLADSAETSRLFCDSRICLSGSSVLMGAIPHVGDLDLFEYVSASNVEEALKELNPKYRADDVICTRLKVSNSKNGEWPNFDQTLEERISCLHPQKMRRFAAKYLLEYNFCKLDMIGRFGEQIGEITNIIYQMPDDENLHSEFPSFSFQEVVLGDQPPIEGAYSLKNFGDYVFFLRDEIEKTIETLSLSSRRRSGPERAEIKLAIKVSKRALVLATLLCQPDDLIEIFKNTLTANESQMYALKSAIGCIQPLLDTNNTLAKDSLDWLTEQLADLNDNPQPKINLQELVEALCELIFAIDALCYSKLEILKEVI